MQTLATFKMNKGDITFRLYEETPIHTRRFVYNAENGNFKGAVFGRVIPGFMAQSGPIDNNTKHSYIWDETKEPRRTKNNNFHAYGVLSAANTGQEHTSMGAFFVCLSRPSTRHLDDGHTTFGHVVDGIELIEQISTDDIINDIIITTS
jgi:cyclophilin family peptidyl-prolyl cis-trans isomerase